jgi:hypothetical protein
MSKKNIDELFQKRFKDFDAVPDEKVWEAIDASLEKKKSRKVIPIWWKLGGVAAVLAGFIFTIQLSKNEFSGNEIEIHKSENEVTEIDRNTNNSNNNQKSKAVDKKNIKIDKNDINYEKNSPAYAIEVEKDTNQNKNNKSLSNNNSNGISQNNHTINQDKNSNISGTNLSKKDAVVVNKKSNILDNKNPSQTNEPKSFLSNSENNTNNIALENNDVIVDEKDDKKKSIFDEIAAKEKAESVVVEDNTNRWSVGPSIAPVYFNSLSEGSSINESFVSNAKSGEINLSYGVKVAYEVNKKLKIRSGIHKAEYGYTTDQISYTSSFVNESIGKLANISYNSSASNIAVSSQVADDSDKELIVANDVTAKSSSYEGGLLQQFGYIEVPFEVNYAIVNKRFGFDVIGGLSSLFLINNSVYLNSGDQTTEVGKANNINSVNFSTNVGFGINYKITEKLIFNAEPLFKYQLNTFSNTSGNFQPFSLGIYSGLNFKF